MSRKVRSARGNIVDFDMLAIKQQLASIPAPVGVAQRRKFIDNKDGLRRKTIKQELSSISALDISLESANISSSKSKSHNKNPKSK